MPSPQFPTPASVIHIDGVSFSYRDSDKLVFDRLHLKIAQRSSVVVAGPDGAGKTTLAKLIKGLLEPRAGRVICACDQRTEVGYLSGDPDESLVGVSVEEDVVFGLENLCLPSAEMEIRLAQALRWTGLAGLERRLTHTLSGGEQQKTALAGMLAMGSRVLVLDEAVTMLDRKAKRSIRLLIQSLRHDHGLTVIECTNDLDAICAADRVIFLAAGEVRFEGAADEFLNSAGGRDWRRYAGGLWHLHWALDESGVVRGAKGSVATIVAHIINYINQ